jgi:DNA sulfur modification protein DndB
MKVEYYSFLAIRGHQGQYEYYVTQCPLRLVPRLFLFDEPEVPSALRQIHSLNLNRVEELVHYLNTQPTDYVLAPLIASIDCETKFESLSKELPDVGQLQVPLSAKLVIHDGHHRRAAISRALAQTSVIIEDTIPIMLLPDPELSRSARLYSELNRPQKQYSKSQKILHDHDSSLAHLVRQLAEKVLLFKGLTEKEKTTISNRSTALFTLSIIHQATQALLGVNKHHTISNLQANLAQQFWEELGQIIPEWQAVIEGRLKSADLRQNYVHAHGVALLAIGQAGHSLVKSYPDDWPKRLKALGEIDWSRKNVSLWEGRAMIRGRMSKTRDSVKLTANVIKKAMGLTLTQEEQSLENHLQRLN